MIYGLILYTEPQRGNIDRARQVLMEKLGLVSPKGELQTQKDVVVWEDADKIGRYRVHLYEDCNLRERLTDAIQFKYWLNKSRAKREIFEQNPMEKAINEVRNVVTGIIEERKITENIDPEEMVAQINSY